MEQLQLTLDLIEANGNEDAPDDELRALGVKIDQLKSQRCTAKIAAGSNGVVYTICSFFPCSTCFAMKLSILDKLDVEVAEFQINTQLFNAFHGNTYHYRAREYDLAAIVSKPIAYVKYIPSGDKPFHTIITGLLSGVSANDLMTSDTVTKEEYMNILRGVFVFVAEATTRVPGFRHNDLHTGNVMVNGVQVSVLDFGLSRTNVVQKVYVDSHVALMDCGNWDCWKFLGHAVYILFHHAEKRRTWAIQVLQIIREFFNDDRAFVYFTQRRDMRLASTRLIMNATGSPFKMDVNYGCNTFYTPVYKLDDGRTMAISGFKEYNARFPPTRFRNYFLRH